MEEQNDRRLFERFWARFPVKFKDSRFGFGTEVFLRDISAAGAHIVCREKLFLNDHISLMVLLPDGREPFPLSGQVVWSKADQAQTWDVGFRFHRLSLMGLQRLFKFCLT